MQSLTKLKSIHCPFDYLEKYIEFASKPFRNITDLKSLIVETGHCLGALNELFPNLSVLRVALGWWPDCLCPPNLRFEAVTCLYLVETYGILPEFFLQFPNLRKLSISHMAVPNITYLRDSASELSEALPRTLQYFEISSITFEEFQNFLHHTQIDEVVIYFMSHKEADKICANRKLSRKNPRKLHIKKYFSENVY